MSFVCHMDKAVPFIGRDAIARQLEARPLSKRPRVEGTFTKRRPGRGVDVSSSAILGNSGPRRNGHPPGRAREPGWARVRDGNPGAALDSTAKGARARLASRLAPGRNPGSQSSLAIQSRTI